MVVPPSLAPETLTAVPPTVTVVVVAEVTAVIAAVMALVVATVRGGGGKYTDSEDRASHEYGGGDAPERGRDDALGARDRAGPGSAPRQREADRARPGTAEHLAVLSFRLEAISIGDNRRAVNPPLTPLADPDSTLPHGQKSRVSLVRLPDGSSPQWQWESRLRRCVGRWPRPLGG